MADTVDKDDVNEAMRLMEMSKDSLNAEERQARYAYLRLENLKLISMVYELFEIVCSWGIGHHEFTTPDFITSLSFIDLRAPQTRCMVWSEVSFRSVMASRQ